MCALVQFERYDRKRVHDELSPNTKFTPQAGTWGLQGIVKIPETKCDYVFFVTFGQTQGAHHFREGIDEKGILDWQTQPQMNFTSRAVQDFINHDPSKGSIYLFLRTNKRDLYTFMGCLAYHSHDTNQQNPVYFRWQILNWDAQKAKQSLHDLVIAPVLRQYPINSWSFTWLSDDIQVKVLDKSAFLHRGTHIPEEVLEYWGEPLKINERRPIKANYQGVDYLMHLTKEVNGRTRLFWLSDFTDILRTTYHATYKLFLGDQESEDTPRIRFRKISQDNYEIDLFSDEQLLIEDGFDDILTDFEPISEGRAVAYNSLRYERNSKNRQRAIEYHGLTCACCGFNFGKFYGTHGAGFIEVHHVSPLYQVGQEVVINHETDLVPLCANCHRMAHHKRDQVLTISEIKAMIGREE